MINKEILKYNYIITGILASILTCVVPTLVILEISQKLSWSHQITANWLFGVFFTAGISGLVLALKTKLPINATSSVPAVVFIGFTAQNFLIEEVFFAFSISGVILILISILNLYSKIEKTIKIEIAMAMFSGTIIHYVLYIVEVTSGNLVWGIVGILTFMISTKIIPNFPAVINVFVILTLLLFLEGTLDLDHFNSININVLPQFVSSDISLNVIFSISLPLVIIVLFSELTIGNFILKSEGYQTKIRLSILMAGIATFFGSMFGGHSVTTSGGPVSVLSDPSVGEKEKRYFAAIWASIFTLFFGLASYPILSLLIVYPSSILKLIVSLILIPIILKTMALSIGSQKFKYGALVAFIITLSNITILNIGSQLWAIVTGITVSYIMDNKDYKEN